MENPENGKENKHAAEQAASSSPKKNFNQMFEEEQKKIDWAEKTFKIDDFLNDPDKLLTKVIPGIGKIEYKLLTTNEMREFKGITNEFDVSLHMLYKMLSKANSNVTFEKIQKLDPLVSGAIMKAILGADRLFLASQAAKH